MKYDASVIQITTVIVLISIQNIIPAILKDFIIS